MHPLIVTELSILVLIKLNDIDKDMSSYRKVASFVQNINLLRIVVVRPEIVVHKLIHRVCFCRGERVLSDKSISLREFWCVVLRGFHR